MCSISGTNRSNPAVKIVSMNEIKKFAVLVAGGKGMRMGSALPKQFLPLNGKPVLAHSVMAFMNAFADIQIIIVLPADQLSYAQMILSALPDPIDAIILSGGETRFHSVQNGLKAIDGEGIVFVHDGARPMVTPTLIKRCFEQALIKGSAIPAIPVADSMRIVDGEDSSPVNRDHMRIIQTPQTFKTEVIMPAFQQSYSADFTDEATVVETWGKEIFLVEGEKGNLKVTTQEDMIIAEALMTALAKN